MLSDGDETRRSIFENNADAVPRHLEAAFPDNSDALELGRAGSRQAPGRFATVLVAFRSEVLEEAALRCDAAWRKALRGPVECRSAERYSSCYFEERRVAEGEPKETVMPTENATKSGSTSVHLWEIKWVQDLFWISLGVGLLCFGYSFRSVFVPIMIGFGLAYMVNPLLRHGENRFNLPRPITIGLILGVFVTAIGLVAVFALPLLVEELQSLSTKTPAYLETVKNKLDARVDDQWIESLDQLSKELPGNAAQLAEFAIKNTGSALGIVGDIISATIYVTISIFLVSIYFFFFAWHFDPMIKQAKKLIPQPHRERLVDLLGKMDEAVGAFLRGRLLITAVMMIMFSIGFCLAGVPYWFLIGVGTGLLSFVPYLAVFGCGLAVMAKWIDVSTGSESVGWTGVVLYPVVAYSIVQVLEGWLLTPWVQSQSMEMSPVAILIIVLIGGSVGGLYGLLLAIPVAACGRILTQELLIPKLDAWAQDA